MTTSSILDEIKPQGSVFSERMIKMAAFFGGPLAVGYLFVENYKALGQAHKVSKAWVISIVGTILLFVLSYYVEKLIDLPGVGFGIISIGITQVLYKREQEEAVTKHLEKGGALQSPWRAAGITLLAFALTMAIPIALVFGSSIEVEPSIEEIVQSPVIESTVANIQTKSYGEIGHVVVYDQDAIDDSEADDIAQQLTTTGFFDKVNQKTVYLEPTERGDYMLSVTDASADPSSASTQKLYNNTKAELERVFLGRRIELLLMDEDLREVLARF